MWRHCVPTAACWHYNTDEIDSQGTKSQLATVGTQRLRKNRDSSDLADLFSHLSKSTPTQNGTWDVMGGCEF